MEALERARTTDNDYLYYIFMDDDCVVEEDKDLARKLDMPLAGNPFRTFERFLLEWEPAVGYTRYDWQHYEKGRAVNLGHNIDGLFNAFHREALSSLLPYYTGFDSESWLYSQHIINHMASLLYHPIGFSAIWSPRPTPAAGAMPSVKNIGRFPRPLWPPPSKRNCVTS